MRSFALYGLIAWLALCPALCRAQRSPVTHDFQAMSSDASKIKFASSNTVGITPLTTYTCTGVAETRFWTDLTYSSVISINLKNKNNFVTTSAIDSLASIKVWHYPRGTAATQVKLQLSRDSVHWSSYIEPDGMYTSDYFLAEFVPGRYYVRLTLTNSTSISLDKIQYSFGACNCFLYIPEE